MKTFLIILITALIAGGGTWLIKSRPAPAATATAKEPLYYQSAMHPWIKSDKPGQCTICGMDLTPIYPGDKPITTDDGANVVSLSDQQIHVINVSTAEAKVQALERKLQVAGMIDDDATRHRIISAYVDGRIEKLHVNYLGAEVKEGEPLAEIYSPGLLQTEREYRQLTGELRRNTGLRLRQMGLSQEQINAVPEKPLDALTSQILSPISGTVVGQEIYEGQYVTTGQRMFEIADFSTMWFIFIAYEQDLPWIRIGQKVTVTTPSLPGKQFEGKVTFIDPNVEEATRAAKIRVELPNPLVDGRRELLHKLYADGQLELDAAPVLAVPRSAVIQTGPQAVVYTDEGGGAYKQVPVQLGRHGDEVVEILSGLEAGAKVVMNGNLLIDGQAELNRSFNPIRNAEPPASGTISPAQREVIRDFVETADAMAAALANDDLAAFNKASEPAMARTAAMTKGLAGISAQQEILSKLNDARHFHGSPDLKSARADFHIFAMAAVDALMPLRGMEDFPEIQIWKCPMVDEAVSGAPPTGLWIQTANRGIANPYFGSEMLTCGERVAP